jgi:hypothetical protein
MCWTPRVYKTQSPVSCIPLVTNTYCGVVFLCLSFSCVLYTLGIQHILWCGYLLFFFLLGKPHHNMCWIPRAYKTQEKDKQKITTPQYVLDTKGIQDTHIVVWFSFVCLSPVSCILLVSNTYCGVVFFCFSFSCVLYSLGIQHITTPQYVLDTKGIQDTGERQTKENHTTICVGYQGYSRHRRKTNKGKPHHNMFVSCIPLVSNTYCGVVICCLSFSCVLYTLGIQHILWCSFPLFVFLCWTLRVFKTQEKDKQRKTTPQYVLDTSFVCLSLVS